MPRLLIAVQSDGKVVVGGEFTSLNLGAHNHIGQLLQPFGIVDSFINPGADGSVHVLAVQSDGSIIVGGAFSNLVGVPCNHIGRLNPDLSLDADFNPDANGNVEAVAIQPDGSIRRRG